MPSLQTVCRYTFILICAFSMLSVSARADTDPFPSDPYDQAAYWMRKGKPDQAIAIYEMLVSQDKNNPDRLKELMFAYWHANRNSEAASIGPRLSRMTPKDTEVLNLWARAESNLGQKQEAMSIYTRSLAVNPDQLSVQLSVARIHIELKDFNSATALLLRLKERYPKEPAIYADQAQIAYLQEHYEDALPLWHKAIDLAPDNLLYQVHEAETLYHMGQMATAHDKLTTVLSNEKNVWPGKEKTAVWALLETVPPPSGEPAKPLKPYAHPLGIDEVQIGLALSRLYSDLRDYESAAGVLLDLEKTHNDNPEIYLRLARQYFMLGRYDSSAAAWHRAGELSPRDVTLKFEEARSLYFSGDKKGAKSILQQVSLVESNAKWRAIDFLTDVALVNHDFGAAQDYLEVNISDLHRPDEARTLRLASIYEERGEITKALSAIDNYVMLNPRDGRALMFKADILLQHGREAEAISGYRKVITLNPVATRAYVSLADALNTQHKLSEALEVISQAVKIDPTNPYLKIVQARYQYDAGDYDGSRKNLNALLAASPRPVVPVVVYHGLTGIDQDPLLAYSVHISTQVFDDQMQAIMKAGYTPITAVEMNEWIHDRAELPVKPILISFDDARLDAFKNADPILKKYKLRATMMVPLVNVDKNLPGYASWDQLSEYQKTGRWEMQGHGDLAHARISVDPEGRSGLYLLNQQWLPNENRYETEDEWIKRVQEDHLNAKRKMLQHLGATPVAFAYPEGDFGQLGLPSSSKAAEINIREATKAFGISFHQDPYGMNLRTRDPQMATRLEPRQEMSGKDLVYWFGEKNPLTFAQQTLLLQATWDGKIHEAFHWLDEMKRQADLSPQLILTQEARIHYAARDLSKANELIGEASTFGMTSELQTLKSSIETQKRFIWNPSFLYQEDNRSRKDLIFDQSLSAWGYGDSRWSVLHTWGSYQENGTPDVTQNGLGIASSFRLGLYHTLDGRIMGQLLSGQSDQTTYTASGGIRSQWTDEWATSLEGGRSLRDTATALNAGIADRYVRASADWAQDGPWEMKSKAKFSDLSDGNDFYEGEFEVTRKLLAQTNIRAGYNVETENMREIRPQYYSPQHLVTNRAVFQASLPIPPGFHFDLRYLPGYGKEDGFKGEFINDIEVSIPIPLGKQTMLTPEAWLSRTPSYRRDSYSLSLTHRF